MTLWSSSAAAAQRCTSTTRQRMRWPRGAPAGPCGGGHLHRAIDTCAGEAAPRGRATAFPTQKKDLRDHGAIWSDGPVEVDGKIITANGPDAAYEFGLAISAALGLA